MRPSSSVGSTASTAKAKAGSIDLYALQDDRSYKVVQCKRSRDGFTPGEVTAAVDRFLDGEWAQTARVFVLAVTANLDRRELVARIEAERSRLTDRGIRFEIWDETEISALLKDQPRLVDDFFGREAVRVYLGDSVADTLGNRLDASEMVTYRDSLGRLYGEVFQRLERGVHGDDRNVPLQDRFVMPDVLARDSSSMGLVGIRSLGDIHEDNVLVIQRAGGLDLLELTVRESVTRVILQGDPGQLPVTGTGSPPDMAALADMHIELGPPGAGKATSLDAVIRRLMEETTRHGERLGAVDWLSTGTQHIVVGAPGAGKSALLRILVLDMLAAEPTFIGPLDRFHGLLPVWLPFAFWTNAVRKGDASVSVLDAVRAWLNAYDHGHLWPLVEKALHDERLLLVVDGFDEWASPDLARACLDRLEVFANTKRANVLASSRPFSTAELPLDTNSWRVAELAPLDDGQRLGFMTNWLTPLVPAATVHNEAQARTDEIDASPHLRELADLPLFQLATDEPPFDPSRPEP